MAEPSEQALLIRAWREALGFSLEHVAFGVSLYADAEGIPKASKKVPRTHASLSRWETGVSEVKETGLRLIAQAMSITVDQIRRPPPKASSPPERQVTVREEDAPMVEAYAEGLRQSRPS